VAGRVLDDVQRHALVERVGDEPVAQDVGVDRADLGEVRDALFTMVRVRCPRS
jgi:hypothetical protein